MLNPCRYRAFFLDILLYIDLLIWTDIHALTLLPFERSEDKLKLLGVLLSKSAEESLEIPVVIRHRDLLNTGHAL
jgi:hypothetical protein